MGSASVLYTLYIVRDDFVVQLKCLCAAMQAIQGSTKLYCTLKYKKGTERLLTSVRNAFKFNRNSIPSRIVIMDKCATRYTSLAKCALGVCLIIILIIGAYPLYSFVRLRKVELFFEIHLIGYRMSDGTMKTYIYNYIAQLLELFYGYQGNMLYDAVLCTIVFGVHVSVELQHAAFQETLKFIRKNKLLYKKKLKNCMVMNQNINSYILELNRTFSSVVFVQIGTGSGTLALSLFCIVTTDWLGAYGFAMFGFVQIIEYCFIGTFLEISSERLANMIYAYPWYLTSYGNRKMILIALIKSQQPTKLTIGGMAQLNIQSGTAIIKTIYSYLMMLLNFTT
ncbi:uncharacterized protein LOC119647278 [Hermetia illucens]|uniref:uncharacterized protein LOC119647278 n=1 Tax=Hermetia illucens TaxID=343691 RepID=UPI0018CC14F0|nr:uncharacterized protein LOC119647278 [Hermetia illucens]